MPLEQLIDAAPVAQALGVSVKRCYELARTGMIPSVRIGRQIRFRPTSVQTFIEGGGAALPGGWKKQASA
jgi:excisionase family DNA binding protein